MAAEVDFTAVLQFLRRNGFSDSESALMEDILDKSRLASSELQKFFFPLAPLQESADAGVGGGWSSNRSSDDEFVSAVSSVTGFCSSDPKIPYSIHPNRSPSQCSSEKLSEFGTAQYYPDFEIQTDLFWDKESNKENGMPPGFGNHDFDCDPSEDKFMMTVQTGEPDAVQFEPKSTLESCKLDGDYHLNKGDKKSKLDCNGYACGDLVNYSLDEIKSRHLVDCNWASSYKSACVDSCKKSPLRNEDDKDEINVHLDDEDDADDDLTTIDNRDEDYEVFELRVIHRKNRTGFEENKELPLDLNTVIAGRYYITEFLGSAAFSRVVQAHDLHSGMDVCLKVIKNDKDFFDQSLDEIKLLKYVNKHDPTDQYHILRLYDYFYHREHLFIVTELLRANLYEFQKYNQESGEEPYFTMPTLQVITRQCLEALLYLHDLGIIHCDLKPENILIKSYRRREIKVIDLGSSCFQTDNMSLYVQSRSYRAPEVMLGLPYNQKIDLWSLGCILAELYSGEVLFPNEAIVLLLARMIALLGPIDMDMLQRAEEVDKYFTKEYDLYHINEETNELEYIIPDESSLEHHLQINDLLFADFLKYVLEINPKKRPNVREVLSHPWLSHKYGGI